MNILYARWNSYMYQDIFQTLVDLGHTVSVVDFTLKGFSMGADAVQRFDSSISNNNFDFVISINYYPEISNICERNHIKYASWTYDAPCAMLYDKSVLNSCNYIFSFDKQVVCDLSKEGINNIYYLPLAVENCFLNSCENSPSVYESEVTFVGSTYTEKLDLFNQCFTVLPDYLKGYFSSVTYSQTLLDGYYILSDLISPEIESLIRNNIKIEPPEGFIMSYKDFIANFILGAKATSLHRINILNELSKIAPISLYTTSHNQMLSDGIIINGPVNHDTDLGKLYASSKINLNITMPNIQNGIPLRCFDIMGSGGFLLTNYRECFSDLFTEGEDLIYYYSLDDLKYKVNYYLSHDEERNTIALNGMKKVRSMHSVLFRIEYIIGTLFP